MTDATNQIAKGNFGYQVKVRSKDELGKLAASFNSMSNEIKHATDLRNQMTADIAHDLRTPLSVISGYAEALSDQKLPGTPEVYGILYQETQHLSRLVEDLRTLSLADAGELTMTIQATCPKAFLERVVVRHQLTAQQKGITLQASVEEELPEVNIDPERMSQVFDNLVSNAFRYTPQGGSVKLSARLADGKLEFVVADNGSGISSADIDHVFDRFYRGDQNREQTGESGLGLAIAKSIVEAHHGTLSVVSSAGQGAAFTIRLPLNAAPTV
jgi:signal transduction histidine kinase